MTPQLGRVIGFALTISVAVGLTACGGHTPPAARPGANVVMPTGCGNGGPVVLAVADHANAPKPGLTTSATTAIASAVKDGSALGVVSVDGRPQLVAAGAFRSDAQNSAARDQDAQTYASNVTATVQSLRPSAGHLDDLAALRVGADAIHAACSAGGSEYLIDSGLQDTGWLNFASTPSLLQADPGEVVAYLRAHNELPPLVGIRVTLAGVGYTSPPQVPLDQASRAGLVAIWQAVLIAGGARSVQIDTSPRSGPAPGQAPAVTPVQVPPAVSFPPAPTVPSFVLPDSDRGVAFRPNVATFRDPAAARHVLATIAAGLASSASTISLLGTTSSAGELTAHGDADRKALSIARARAVKSALVALGIDPDRITIGGNGYHFSGYVADRDRNGVLLPGPAALNRSVRISVTAA